MRKLYLILIIISFSILYSCTKEVEETPHKRGSVIFIHPDGTGLATWNAMRILYYGPDAKCNWDRMPGIGLYRAHQLNCLTSTSNAGATTHAYGVKAERDSYGRIFNEQITSRSGKKMTIMEEAHEAGIKTGLINSGSIIEPGTGVFVADAEKRADYQEITKKIVQSGTDVILSGGEEWFLPEGVEGKFGLGQRTDGLNLIDWAKENGYTIAYNRDELLNIPNNTNKLLGIFAKIHTFNDKSEEELGELEMPMYNEEAPTLEEMVRSAVEILSRNNQQFYLVVEEEGTDNFGNKNNAKGMLYALKRADDAIGYVLDYMEENPAVTLITAADSEAGGMELIGDPPNRMDPNEPLPEKDRNGAPIDGENGTGTQPFMSKPDKAGVSLPFAIAWSTGDDIYGSVVARAAGLNAEMMRGDIDNTDIYKIMYATLFGKELK